ncbi:MAG: DNA repair protein RecO [Caldisericum sp.]|uniref:DNA repair protein RecO n=1 Tax=Caldisericum sp. TaxID=2499687 RepID=UPI003D1433FA
MGYINVYGLTITAFPSKDSDRYVVILTDRLGKIIVKFRSVRSSASKRSGYTGSFVYEKLQLYKKGNTYIATEIEMLNDFRNTKEEFPKMLILLYLQELLILLLPYEEENLKVLELTIETLQFLNLIDQEYSQLALIYYMFHLLRLLGSPINFPKKQPKAIYFSIENNGFNEISGFPVDKKLYEEALYLSKMDHPELIKLSKSKDIIYLLNYYIIQKFELDAYKKFLENIENIDNIENIKTLFAR